jgi:hypothetical protein
VAEDQDAPGQGVVGYLGFFHFMNERPGYFITAEPRDLPASAYQNRRLGTYLLGQAIQHAPSLGVEVLAATIFASKPAEHRALCPSWLRTLGLHAAGRSAGRRRARPAHDGPTGRLTGVGRRLARASG